MCTENIIEFGNSVINEKLVKDKTILDVGAYDVNGSLKNKIMEFGPKTYVGVDIREGPNVDLVCDISNLAYLFGENAFDGIICTEVLEHVQNWQLAILNLKRVVNPGGFVLITAPTIGFPFHEYPNDYWRFTLGDFMGIFADFDWIAWKEHSDPGVCILVRKPMVGGVIAVPTLNIEKAKK
jgi:SAM-dependent methyltransferase